jgi:hypothetical protein
MGALSAALLYILASIFSETDVETHRWRIFAVALGIGLLEFVLTRLLVGWLWSLFILLVIVLLIAGALTYWCGTPRKQALKIAGIYTGIRVALGIAVILFFPVA